ncbi:MAG: hypothetical protein IJA75_09655 [Oscillospiraceae bacterium]|nr:hypothetical protein [Oscillospiraceae bacterium]
MESRKIVFHETGIVLLGEVICSSAMVAVFALLGKYDIGVLLGAVAGALLATGNFFFMAVSTSLAADKAAAQDVKGGKALVHSSYLVRMPVLFILLFACAKSGIFNLFALVLPLVFVRPTITVAEFFRKKGENQP